MEKSNPENFNHKLLSLRCGTLLLEFFLVWQYTYIETVRKNTHILPCTSIIQLFLIWHFIKTKGTLVHECGKRLLEGGLKQSLRSQHAQMDLNTKSWPKQKTIKSLMYKAQGFQITINENPPTWETFLDKFWFSPAGIELWTFGLEV